MQHHFTCCRDPRQPPQSHQLLAVARKLKAVIRRLSAPDVAGCPHDGFTLGSLTLRIVPVGAGLQPGLFLFALVVADL